MATASLSTKKMPLPLQIFYGAMERQVPLADYARTIDLHPDILHQALTGRLQGADSQSVTALAKALNRDLEPMDLTIIPFDESFGMWLKRNMEGITQHALRARTQLDNQTLKRFLNGDLLPDSDQAERISRALYIDRIEIARVVTANMAAALPSIARQASAEAGAKGGQSVTGTRRRHASLRHTNADPGSLLSAVDPTTIGETAGEMAAAALEPYTTAPGDASIRGKRPKRASKPEVQVQAPVVASMAAHWPLDAVSTVSPGENQEAGQDGDSLPAEAPLPSDQRLQPIAQSMRITKSRSRRQPNQAITSSLNAAVDPSSSTQDGRQPTMEQHPASQPAAPAAAEQAAIPTPAAAKIVAEKEAGMRRPKQSTAHDLASVATAEQTPALPEMTMMLDDRPAGGVAAEDKGSRRAGSRRRPTSIGATATDVSTGDGMPSSFAAEIAPSAPNEPSADLSTDKTMPLVTAELAADTTILQLSADEVRLIRHWRQLHPHGRRATLQYIGSLLVDD